MPTRSTACSTSEVVAEDGLVCRESARKSSQTRTWGKSCPGQQGLKDSVRHVKLHTVDGCCHARNQYLDEREGCCACGNVARKLTGVCCCLCIPRCAKLKGLSAIGALKSSTTLLSTTSALY